MKLDMSGYEPFGLEPIETASRDEIAALQAERLQRTLQNVYENVPAYRKKFDAAGVTASDFSRLEDLEKFPFTTKRDLRENYPFGMFAVPRERIVRIHASSGTTGKPTVVGYTRNDIDTWANLVARSLRAAGDWVDTCRGVRCSGEGPLGHLGPERGKGAPRPVGVMQFTFLCSQLLAV